MSVTQLAWPPPERCTHQGLGRPRGLHERRLRLRALAPDRGCRLCSRPVSLDLRDVQLSLPVQSLTVSQKLCLKLNGVLAIQGGSNDQTCGLKQCGRARFGRASG